MEREELLSTSQYQAGNETQKRTPIKYLVSPSLSKYRRQKGRVPKLALMVLSRDFAVVRRNGMWGASAILA